MTDIMKNIYSLWATYSQFISQISILELWQVFSLLAPQFIGRKPTFFLHSCLNVLSTLILLFFYTSSLVIFLQFYSGSSQGSNLEKKTLKIVSSVISCYQFCQRCFNLYKNFLDSLKMTLFICIYLFLIRITIIFIIF